MINHDWSQLSSKTTPVSESCETKVKFVMIIKTRLRQKTLGIVKYKKVKSRNIL